MAVLVGMITGAMTLSAFTTSKQDAKTECSQTKMNDDNWKVFRDNVAFCDADTDQCFGYGTVYLNTDNYQVAILVPGWNDKIDLGEYTLKDGYNWRFWHPNKEQYCYVNLFIPKEAYYR